MQNFSFKSDSPSLSPEQAEQIKELLTSVTEHALQATSDPQGYIDEVCAAFEMPESFEAAASRLADPAEQPTDEDAPAAPAEPSPEDQAAVGHFRAAQESMQAVTRLLRQSSEDQQAVIGADYDQYAEDMKSMVDDQISDYLERLDDGEFTSADQATDAMRATGQNIRTGTGRVQASVLGPQAAEKLAELKQESDKQMNALLEEAVPPLSEFLAYVCFERELIPEEDATAFLQRIGEAVAGPQAQALLN